MTKGSVHSGTSELLLLTDYQVSFGLHVTKQSNVPKNIKKPQTIGDHALYSEYSGFKSQPETGYPDAIPPDKYRYVTLH